MKTFILTTLFIFSINLLANELAWVDEQIEAIKPPRKGIPENTIAKLKNPFIFLEVKTEKKKTHTIKHTSYKKSVYKRVKHAYSVKLSLEATMNSSALINGKWYKKGEKVHGYILKEVNVKTVLLIKGKKKITLSILSKNKNLKIKNN